MPADFEDEEEEEELELEVEDELEELEVEVEDELDEVELDERARLRVRPDRSLRLHGFKTTAHNRPGTQPL